jgi:DNA repair exonuclease SbcCD ATPase subunit
MKSLLKFIKCSKCFELLENPVALPCGNSICEKHQKEDRDDNNSVYCSVCDLHHVIPNGGFIRILALEKLIERKINNIDLGDEYRSAYDKLEDFSELLEKLEKLKNDPSGKIYSKISKLRNNIDLRREELKSQIDKDALSIIKQLDEYETECKANLVSIKADVKTNEKLNKWKEDLDRWQHQMRTFNKDIEMWKKIYEEASIKYDEMDFNYLNLDCDIFLGRRISDLKDLKYLISCDIK